MLIRRSAFAPDNPRPSPTPVLLRDLSAALPRPREPAKSPGPAARPILPAAAPTRLREPPGGLRPWIRALRVRQWSKNLLVFGAPAAADALDRPNILLHVSICFVGFCLLASGAYLINDVRDAPEDRRHPRKRHRPIASGMLAERGAAIVGVSAVALGLAASAAVGWRLLAIAAAYVLLNAGYTVRLRSVVLVDIITITGMFVLRAAAGGVAAGVPIRGWFVIVVSSAALFVASGKRYADFLDPAARSSRAVLERYSAGFLRLTIVLACATTLTAYSGWALGTANGSPPPWRALTVVPFTTVVLRYALLVMKGSGGAPEEILFGDRFIQLTGAGWLMMLVAGV